MKNRKIDTVRRYPAVLITSLLICMLGSTLARVLMPDSVPAVLVAAAILACTVVAGPHLGSIIRKHPGSHAGQERVR